MTGNPLSGHTKANLTLTGTATAVDGLTDGDHILSPTMTNYLEGIHGNGILLEEDTAYGDSDRDVPENLPGTCDQVTNTYTFRVTGGTAILDGVLYSFAGGHGGSIDVPITTTSVHKTGSPTALTSGQEALVVVYVSSDGGTPDNVYWEMGTPVTTASNTYPTSPSAFLNAPGSLTNKNTCVLATLRVVYNGAGGDLKMEIEECNDKRVFARPSPIYFTPVTSGSVAATNAVTDIDTVHSGDEAGDLAGSRMGALWQSYNADGDSLLYYSAKDSGGTRHTHVLGPSGIKSLTPSTTTTFTFNESNVFVITPTAPHQFNPTGTFPAGHTVFVSNHAAHGTNSITFDNGGLGAVLDGKEAGVFVYDGTNWQSVIFASGAVSPNAHGGSGYVQLSDGVGGFTSDANLTWASSPAALTINGKLNVSGLIDPTGLVIDEKANVAATGHTTAAGKGLLWVKSDAPNRLYFTDDAGTDKKVIHATDSVTELSDVTNAGSGAIITVSERNLIASALQAEINDLTAHVVWANVPDANITQSSVTQHQGALTVDDSQVTAAVSAANYTPSAATVEGHLSGIDTALASAGAVTSVNTQTGAVVLDADDLADGSTNVMMTSAERTKLTGIETSATADQDADEVPVAATPTNYTAASADVEAHLTGIDTALGAVSVTETDPVFSASPAASITNAGSGLVTTSAERTNWNAAYGWGDHGAAGYLTSAPAPDLLLLDSNGVNMTAGTKASWNTLTNFVARTSSGTAPTYNATLGQITINAAGTYEMILSIVFRNATAGWGLAWSSSYTNYTRMWVTRGATTELGPVQMTYSSSMQNTLVRVLDLQAGDIITPVVYWNMSFSSMECFENSPTTIGFQNYCMIRKVS